MPRITVTASPSISFLHPELSERRVVANRSGGSIQPQVAAEKRSDSHIEVVLYLYLSGRFVYAVLCCALAAAAAAAGFWASRRPAVHELPISSQLKRTKRLPNVFVYVSLLIEAAAAAAVSNSE